MRVQTLTLCLYIAGQNHTLSALNERSEVHALHVHLHVVRLVIDVIESTQKCLAALIVRLAVHIDPHVVQVQRRGQQIHGCAYLVRTHMQAVRRNDIFRNIHMRVAVDRVRRDTQLT